MSVRQKARLALKVLELQEKAFKAFEKYPNKKKT